jgi:MYXO-CTERM domain-containing protein
MRSAHGIRRTRALPLIAGLAAACLLAHSRAAAAAAPDAGLEPGATCTRSRCAPDAAATPGGLVGFAAAALATIGLGRRRAASPGPPRA